MSIAIKADLAREMIRRLYGSVDDLVVEWEHRAETRRQKRGAPRDRATIYRWLKCGLPLQTDDIYGFAALLDIDPVCLIDLDHDDSEVRSKSGCGSCRMVAGLFDRLEQERYRRARERARETDWPNHALAMAFFGRRWHVVDFSHDPATIRNVFAGVVLETDASDSVIDLRAYHFASRRVGVSDRRWRPIGVLIADAERTTLVSECGDWQIAPRAGDRTTIAELFLGPAPVEFRIASLHRFGLGLQVPSRSAGTVRFQA